MQRPRQGNSVTKSNQNTDRNVILVRETDVHFDQILLEVQLPTAGRFHTTARQDVFVFLRRSE